jgi:hypothetical protein
MESARLGVRAPGVASVNLAIDLFRALRPIARGRYGCRKHTTLCSVALKLPCREALRLAQQHTVAVLLTLTAAAGPLIKGAS